MITDTKPTPNGTHASLLDRKIKLGEQFSCRALFEQIDAVDTELTAALARKAEVDTALGFARAGVEDAEALIHVEGRNEIERKAAKIRALRDDPFHQAAMGELRDAEGQSHAVETEIDALKRRARRLEGQIQYRVAILRFLAD